VSESGISIANAKIAAQKIDHAASTIKGLQMHTQTIHTDLRSGWDSTAADAFTTMFTKYDEDFTAVLNALQDMHQKLGQGTIKYESMIQEQHDAVNAVAALINR
jgi:WXG100 family type VII secretion target